MSGRGPSAGTRCDHRDDYGSTIIFVQGQPADGVCLLCRQEFPALRPIASARQPEPTDLGLREWQRDLLTFDADGLSFDQVVANLLGVKSVDLRTEQDDEGNATSEDRRWRVQYFGGTYGGTLRQCLDSVRALSEPKP